MINAAIGLSKEKETGYKGAGGNRGAVSKPFYSSGPKKPTDSRVFYCEVCKVSCGGAQTYQTHMEGKGHKKKVAQTQAGGSEPRHWRLYCLWKIVSPVCFIGLVTSSLKAGQIAFHCELCDITCTSQDAFNSHTAGAKHQKV